jgi:hypothetical protein
MKKSDITLGKRYAVKFDGPPQAAAVIRPEKDRWVVVFDPTADLPEDPVSARTETVPSRAILAPWTDYCIDSAHDHALAMDRRRTDDLEYDREREAEAKRKRPFIEALQGITVPGKAFTSSNVPLPDVDLADKLHEIFVEQTVAGTSVTFDVFEALAREILDLRSALLDTGGMWAGDAIDTGVPEVDATIAAAADAANAVALLDELVKSREAGDPVG